MALLRIRHRIVNTEHLIEARFSRSLPPEETDEGVAAPDRLHLTFLMGSVTFSGEDARRVFAALANLADEIKHTETNTGETNNETDYSQRLHESRNNRRHEPQADSEASAGNSLSFART